MATSYEFKLKTVSTTTPSARETELFVVAADAAGAAAAWSALGDTDHAIVEIRRTEVVDGIASDLSDTLAGNPLTVDLDAAGHGIANLSFFTLGGVKFVAGLGVPVDGSEVDGTVYIRGDGTVGSVFYHAEGGAWVPVA